MNHEEALQEFEILVHARQQLELSTLSLYEIIFDLAKTGALLHRMPELAVECESAQLQVYEPFMRDDDKRPKWSVFRWHGEDEADDLNDGLSFAKPEDALKDALERFADIRRESA